MESPCPGAPACHIARAWTARALLVLLLPSAALAVLIDSGDGTGNTTAPSPDPGFANVGEVNGLTGVYVGNGWVLTAEHVGEGPIELDGVTYDPILGSERAFLNPDLSRVDLVAFKLQETPPLPDLPLATASPQVGDALILIGNGRNRGAATRYADRDGWLWGAGRAIRWGTNEVVQTEFYAAVDGNVTESFVTRFDAPSPGPPGGGHESALVPGDSGGAAFRGTGASAELLGILFALATTDPDQPANASFYGDFGLVVDLHHYRSDILAVVDQPACDDGIDDDGDGLTDYPADPGCSSATDTNEREAGLVCDDDVDDDGDGLAAHPEDPGCIGPADASERETGLACDDGLDDDGDGLADFPDDPGCLDALDPSERESTLECDDGEDDDGDGRVDFPADPGCASGLDTSELDASVECDNGTDDDGDGLADADDPGCLSASDPDELELDLVCDNGLDDDGDGTVDLADGGCADGEDPSERGAPYACDNGLDDDGDGFFDYPHDPDCAGPTDTTELPEPSFTTLVGLGAGALAAVGRRRRRYSSTRSTR